MKMFFLTAATALILCANAPAQHLWWNLEGQKDATCLYGEITVLATHPADLLLRGELASWGASGRLLRHPAQQREGTPHDLLHLGHVAQASSQGHGGRPTHFSTASAARARAGTPTCFGIGSGRNLSVLRAEAAWKDGDTTDTRYYVYDRKQKKWLHSATITSPNGGKRAWRPSAAG